MARMAKKYVIHNRENVTDKTAESFKVAVTAAKYRVLKTGFYKIRLVGIGRKKGKYNGIFVFNYEITSVLASGVPAIELRSFVGCNVNDLITDTCARNGKLWRIMKQFSGKAYEEGEQADLSALIGKECYAFITVNSEKNHVNKIVEYFSKDEYESISKAA